MKIIGKQRDLSKGLSTVVHVVDARPRMPILSNVLLTIDKGRLKIVGSNVETSITCWIDVEVEEEGTTTLPARLVTDFVNNLPPVPIQIAIAEDTHRAKITGAWSVATINGIEPSEFPLSESAETDSGGQVGHSICE